MKKPECLQDFLEYAKENIPCIKVVIAGSRGYSNYKFFNEFVNLIFKEFPDFTIISGDASHGPDKMAIEWAREHGVICEKYPAKWDDTSVPNARLKFDKKGRQYNANAGHDRNIVMAKLCDFYVIFWDGKSPGSKHMLDICKKENKYGIVIMV